MQKIIRSYIHRLWVVAVICFFTFPASNHAAFGPRHNKSSISPWIVKKNGAYVYKFNVFNLAPDAVSMEDLKSMMKASQKDINTNYKKDYGLGIDIKVYPAEQLSNPELFKGDRIPFFVVENFAPGQEGGLAFHSVQASEPANSESFLFEGASISSKLGIEVPINFPSWTPYGAASTGNVQEAVALSISTKNPYALKSFIQSLSFSINHEFKEALFDDSEQNWVLFDTFAPTVATWRFAELNAKGVCINGRKGKDGFIHLPLFLDVFPEGGLLLTIQENGDPVSVAFSSKLNSYLVDGWRMTNYPVSNFWKGYYNNDNAIKWDANGLVEDPLQPFAGVLEEIFFLDFQTGYTFVGVVENAGPVTFSQRGTDPSHNFPPNYTIINFQKSFAPDDQQRFKKPRILQSAAYHHKSKEAA